MATPYFTYFPILPYDILKNGQTTNMRNLLRGFRIRPEVIDNRAAYYKFDIRDWDTPENLADKLYGSSHLYWIIFKMNEGLNPFWDWPLTQRQLEEFLVEKYPGDALFVSALTGQFTVGETVTGGTSAATGVVVSTDVTNFNTASQTVPYAKVVITSPTGTFTAAETITGGTSEKTATFQSKQLNTQADHHFQDADLNQIDATTSSASAVSNHTYEDTANEVKRSIKILRQEFIGSIVKEFESVITSGGN